MKYGMKNLNMKVKGELDFNIESIEVEYSLEELAQFAANFKTVLETVKETVKELVPVIIKAKSELEK